MEKTLKEKRIKEGKLNVNISCILEDKLWIGNEDSSLSLERLKDLEIKNILVAGSELEKYYEN